MADDRYTPYPWDKWGNELPDGKVWMVTRFVDYKCESRSFASQIYNEARRRGMKVTVTVFESYVLFAFFRADSLWKPNMPALPQVKKIRKKYGLPN